MASSQIVEELRKDLAKVEAEISDLTKAVSEKKREWTILDQTVALYAKKPVRQSLHTDQEKLPLPPHQEPSRGKKETIILDFLKRAGRSMKSKDIREGLRLEGHEINQNTFDALMSKMSKDERVGKPSYGHYEYKQQTQKGR